MTAKETTPPVETPKITLDDIKHRAEAIKDLAVADAKDAVAVVAEADATKKLMIAVGVVVVIASFAYFLGSRAARRAEEPY